MIVSELSLTVLITVCNWLACSLPATAKPVRSKTTTLIEGRIENLKQKILMGLNYSSVPSVSGISDSVHEKRRMIQQYRDMIRNREDASKILHLDDADDSSTEGGLHFHSYKYTGAGNELIETKKENFGGQIKRLHFRVNVSHPEDDHTMETRVKLAKLKLFKHSSAVMRTNNSQDEIVIKIFVVKPENMERKLIQSRIVDISRDGWEIFEVTDVVQDWINNPKSNYGLEIYTDAVNINQLILPSVDLHKNDSSNSSLGPSWFPILEFQTHERSILKRVKRQDSGRRDCTKGDGESRCCRFRTHISFSEIGWNDWILAPEGFDAYFCDGECPHRFKMANNFAGIQSVLHLNNPKKYPKLCCVPSKLSPLTILHKDDKGRYMFKDYPDLVVEDCRCA